MWHLHPANDITLNGVQPFGLFFIVLPQAVTTEVDGYRSAIAERVLNKDAITEKHVPVMLTTKIFCPKGIIAGVSGGSRPGDLIMQRSGVGEGLRLGDNARAVAIILVIHDARITDGIPNVTWIPSRCIRARELNEDD